MATTATTAAAQTAPPSAPPAAAAPPASAPAGTTLAPITNTATRTERRADAVPATVTVQTARDAEARGVRDAKDLFRYEVDLAVRLQPGRYTAAGASTGRGGNEGLNVRGLEGNQVLLLVDGVRLPQSFSFGPFQNSRLDTLFTEALVGAEVLRGPASTQFGSDGLAGAVEARTLEPSDVLAGSATFGGFVRGAAATVDDGIGLTAALAGKSGGLSWLALVSRRESRELDNQGTDDSPDSRRTTPNPTHVAFSGALGKLRVALTPAHTLGATVEAVRRASATDVISARTPAATPPATLPATAVLGLAATDLQERARFAAEWFYDDLNAPLVQRARARAYVQESEVEQVGREDRVGTDRVRIGTYRERITGLAAEASASLVGPRLTQRLSAGIDLSGNTVTGVRDGTVPPFGEAFPSKPFPDTRYRLFGAFVQDEIEVGAFSVIPALRFDRYQLDPDAAGYTASEVVSLSDQAVTPRLGVVWALAPTFRPYLQWSRGFRAPTPGQVNNGFSNPASGYRSIGNPNLKPERAESVELGVRGSVMDGALRWHALAYDNRYEGFISQQQVSGSFTPADPAIFQFINLAEARIRGFELRLEAQPWRGGALKAAYASARGDSIAGATRTPLLTIEPARWHLGVVHEIGAFMLRGDVVHAEAKAADRLASPTGFATPSYTTLDLGASWQVNRRFALHLALDNVTDETYWRYGDARSLSATSAIKDAFTAPGRSMSLTARYDF